MYYVVEHEIPYIPFSKKVIALSFVILSMICRYELQCVHTTVQCMHVKYGVNLILTRRLSASPLFIWFQSDAVYYSTTLRILVINCILKDLDCMSFADMQLNSDAISKFPVAIHRSSVHTPRMYALNYSSTFVSAKLMFKLFRRGGIYRLRRLSTDQSNPMFI